MTAVPHESRPGRGQTQIEDDLDLFEPDTRPLDRRKSSSQIAAEIVGMAVALPQEIVDGEGE